jgi:hypothetical protein
VVPRKEEHDAKAERCARCNNRITETLFKRLIQSFLRIHASIFTYSHLYPSSSPHFLRVKKKEREKNLNGVDDDAPGAGFGAKTPVSLSNIHDFGAFKRFKCFLGPRTMMSVY